jgi:hypothetical protein
LNEGGYDVILTLIFFAQVRNLRAELVGKVGLVGVRSHLIGVQDHANGAGLVALGWQSPPANPHPGRVDADAEGGGGLRVGEAFGSHRVAV